MLTLIVSESLFDQIASGKLTEIHKPITPYYTGRFRKRFGIIGDESNIEDIAIMIARRTHEDKSHKVISSSLRIGTGEGYKFSYCKIPRDEERYIITVHAVRDYVKETDYSFTNDPSEKIQVRDVVEVLKKKQHCILNKQSCDKNCSECTYNISEEELYETIKATLIYMSDHDDNKRYYNGYKTGYKKAYQEIDAFDGLKTPREVINTEGYEPYCQVCRSASAIYGRDGSRNIFCGKCGTLLSWKSVMRDEDNYERIKTRSENTFRTLGNDRNYYLRMQAVNEFLKENKSMVMMQYEMPEPPEENKLGVFRKKRGRKRKDDYGGTDENSR